MDPKMKFFYPVVKAVDDKNRRITVCISKNEIDRHGERIEIQAIADALALYATNPVVLGDHQHRLTSGKSSVIGHAPSESYQVQEKEVDMSIVFSVTENAETYWINYRDGHQKAVSIGFIDLDWRKETVDGREVYVTTKMELIEVSCVAVGANRGALVKVAGMFDRYAEKDIPESAKEFLDTNHAETLKHISELKTFCEEGIEDIKSLLITDSGGLAERLLGGPSEPSDPAGDKNKAEQIVKDCNQIQSLL